MGVYTGTGPTDPVVGNKVSTTAFGVPTSDAIQALASALTAYTPTWSASGTAPVLGNGTIVGGYTQVGKAVYVDFKLTAGSTTTYGTGTYSFSLPVTAVTGYDFILTGFIGDSSVGAAGYTNCIGFVASGASTVQLYAGNTGASQQVSATTPQTFANGDRIWFSGWIWAA